MSVILLRRVLHVLMELGEGQVLLKELPLLSPPASGMLFGKSYEKVESNTVSSDTLTRNQAMSSSYTGWHARTDHRLWGVYTARTLAATLEMIDLELLRQVPERLGRAPRVLDVGCGTGVLLRWLLERLPLLEVEGVDASADMLQQARSVLRAWPQVHLLQAEVGPGPTAWLPFAPSSFDLITCTNTLHYFAAPIPTLAGLRLLLALAGQLVLEDYARRGPPFPWRAFEWLVRRVDTGYRRAYTLAEAQALCLHAGLYVARERAFPITWLWQGWTLRAQADTSLPPSL